MLFRHKSKFGKQSDQADLISTIITDGIDNGVIVVDKESNVGLFNPSAQQITGWTIEDATGLHSDLVVNFIDDQGREYPKNLHPIRRAFIEKQVITDDKIKIVTRSGKQTPIFVSCSPMINDRGSVEGVIIILRNSSLDLEKEAHKSEFISTASHEMRTPIAAVSGFLELVLNDKVCQIDDKARNYLERASTSIDNLSKLLHDLLTTGQSEDGLLVNQPAIVEVGSFLRDIAETNFGLAEKKGLIVRFLIGSSQVGQAGNRMSSAPKPVHTAYYIYADPTRIQEVIDNVFSNSIKYTEQGEITIALDANEEVVQIKIQDTGIGMSAEDIPHIFEKFYRVNSSATQTIGGTGLGLFISKKIVELYGGQIWAESTLGKGSTFYITLPRLSPEVVKKMLDQTIIPANT